MKYVLGGGIAGLVYAHFHPDYHVLAAAPGGAMASELPIGPRWIHASWATNLFLQDLSMVIGEKQAVHSLIEKGPTRRSTDPWVHYALKTRGVKHVGDRFMEESHDVYMFPALSDITRRLTENLISTDRLEIAKIVHVDGQRQFVETEDGHILPYHDLVVTIPLPQFLKMFDSGVDMPVGGAYIKVPVRFCHYELLDETWPWPGVDYVYFTEDEYAYSRISKLWAEGKEWACFEYPGLDSMKSRAVGSFFDSRLEYRMELGRCASSVVFPYGRVISRDVPQHTLDNLAKQGITLFGRFAEWQDHLLTHHLVERARVI